MSTEPENPQAGAAEPHPVARPDDGSIVAAGDSTDGAVNPYQDLPVVLRQILNVLITPKRSGPECNFESVPRGASGNSPPARAPV